MATIDIWTAIAAPLPAAVIQWRQQGRPMGRDGKFFARFVAYIDAQFVRERLDRVVPGEWDLTLELLPAAVTGEGEEVEPFSFKGRLQILGVIRESVGSGKDYKTAETDAFKRAGVRFGVGSELYAMEQLWVQMDGDGKFAKPVEEPSVAYARRYGRPKAVSNTPAPLMAGGYDNAAPEPTRGETASGTDDVGTTARATDLPECPKCGKQPMWDNRLTKRNPKAPDFKCRDRACDGVIWPPKAEPSARATAPADDDEEPPF